MNTTAPFPTARLVIVAALTVPWFLFLTFDFAAMAGSGSSVGTEADWLIGFLGIALFCSLPFAALFAWLAPVFVVKFHRDRSQQTPITKPMAGIHFLAQALIFGILAVAPSILPEGFSLCVLLPCILLHLAAPIFSARVSLQLAGTKATSTT